MACALFVVIVQVLAVPGHGPRGERVKATVSIEAGGVLVNRMPRKRLEVRRYLCGDGEVSHEATELESRRGHDVQVGAEQSSSSAGPGAASRTWSRMCLTLVVGGNTTATRVFERVDAVV